MNTEAIAKYTDRIAFLHEQIQNVTEQEKKEMCDRKFFTGKDYELLMFVREYYKYYNLREGIVFSDDLYLTAEEKAVISNILQEELFGKAESTCFP